MMYLYVYLSNVLRDLKEEAGQGMAEYALILALVAVLLILALGSLQGGIEGAFQDVTDALNGTTGEGG